MKIRFAITVESTFEGMETPVVFRQLAFPNQAQNHFDDRNAANKNLLAMKDDYRQRFGKEADTLQVEPIFCYDNGDAVGVFPCESMDEEMMKKYANWVSMMYESKDQAKVLSGGLAALSYLGVKKG